MPTSALRHVAVDHVGPVRELAGLIVALAKDTPGDAMTTPSERLEIEARIAEGTFGIADWSALERVSSPSGLNCPECRSALYDILDARLIRFRCRSGHAFSGLSLLDAQATAREGLLSARFGAVAEEAAVARRVIASGDAGLAPGRMDERVARLEELAERVASWLRTPVDGA
jgi:two-component system chemotaxis response regulator CheB